MWYTEMTTWRYTVHNQKLAVALLLAGVMWLLDEEVEKLKPGQIIQNKLNEIIQLKNNYSVC